MGFLYRGRKKKSLECATKTNPLFRLEDRVGDLRGLHRCFHVMSRRLPQFNRDSLEQTIPAAGIRYEWMKALGGYRKAILDDSPNIALRNDSFRNYADYMLTPEFESAIAEVIQLAEATPTACMTAAELAASPPVGATMSTRRSALTFFGS